MTHIMAILNVTPDSFSDGGRFASWQDAVAEGIRLRDLGADLIDVGGESTRPGAQRLSQREEMGRVIPVIRGLVAAGVEVSIDTMNANTALAAADAGASIINDVSGGLADEGMYQAVAATGLGYIATHSRGSSDAEASYGDVVTDVRNDLKQRIAEMTVYGIDPGRVILDPGLGFAKTAEHNWQLLSRLDELATLGHPILVGASRKRFLSPWGEEPEQRDAATAVISALAARSGAWGVRVHDVESTRMALGVESAWSRAAWKSGSTK